MKIIDTFSENSLKTLDKSLEEFKNKYVYNLFFKKQDKRAKLGQKFHSLICAYLNDIPIKKMLLELNENELLVWNNLKNKLEPNKDKFIKTEYPFLIKEKLGEKPYYLTGRIDAILKENDCYTIYDWKTLSLPSDADFDLQTIVYLYCVSIIFKSEKIKIRYLSIEKLDFIEANFKSRKFYKERIDEIIQKYYANLI